MGTISALSQCLATFALLKGMVPSNSMYQTAQKIYSWICKTGQSILGQVNEDKCFQDTIKKLYILLFFETNSLLQCLHNSCLFILEHLPKTNLLGRIFTNLVKVK